MRVRANGIGGTTGDALATCKPLQYSGDVWFVNSTGGVDAASPAGKDREKPLATLGQAYTNAAAGDMIVLLSGHTETVTVALNVAKAGLDIVGEGSSGGIPTVRLLVNSATAGVINITAAGVRLRNILFPASVISNTGTGGGSGKIHVNGGGSKAQLIGCYFQEGATDQLPGVTIATGMTDIRLENCTFISTATVVATRPTYGFLTQGTVTDLDVFGCVFSDGTVGFANVAWDSTGGTITRLRALGVSALLGADIAISAATVGFLNLQTTTGGGRVEW